MRIVSTTLDDAVVARRSGMARLRSVHGAPRPIGTIADMLVLDADYRVRFGGSRLRPLKIRIMLPSVLAACVVALSVILLVASFR